MNQKQVKRLSAADHSDDEVVISLERTPCFGPCPAYSLMIFSDGRVIYQGNKYVAVEGKRKYKIPKYKIKELVKHFHRIGYFDLKDLYEPIATDGPGCITCISINGHTKRVAHWQPSNAPPSLDELEEKIDEIAGSAKFVKKSDKYSLELGVWGLK